MKIRKANQSDVKKIARIFKKEYSKSPYNEKWSYKIAIKRIKKDLESEEIFVLEVNKKIAGFITLNSYLWHTGLRGFIHEIVISSEFQGRGYGKNLLNFAERHFKKKGAKEIQLISSPKSKAFKIYKKLNYMEEGYVTMYKRI